MTNILSKLRGLTKAVEYEATIPDLEKEVSASQDALEKLVASRGPAFFDLSEIEQKDLDNQIRDAGLKTRNLEMALTEARKRLAEKTTLEAREREEAKLKSDAKQWAADSKVEFELRSKWLSLAVEAFKVHQAYFRAREKGNAWRTSIGRADVLGLKPVDPLAKALAKTSRPHPVNDQALYQALQAAANFKSELDELGVKAA